MSARARHGGRVSPYRQAPTEPSVPRAPWWRIARAWADGTLKRAEDRRYRNRVLSDPDGAVRGADNLSDLFRVGTILLSRGIGVAPSVAREHVDRVLADEPKGDVAVLTAIDGLETYENLTRGKR